MNILIFRKIIKNFIYNDGKYLIFCIKIGINLPFIIIMYLKLIFNKFICYNDLLKIGIFNECRKKWVYLFLYI